MIKNLFLVLSSFLLNKNFFINLNTKKINNILPYDFTFISLSKDENLKKVFYYVNNIKSKKNSKTAFLFIKLIRVF